LVLVASCSTDKTTTPIDTMPPLPPVGLQAASEGGDLVRLSWTQNAESDLAGYKVYRSDEQGSFGPVTAQTLICPWYYGQVTTMEAASFTVTAVDENGNESAFSDPVSVYINTGWRDRYTNPAENR
jgi:hypothetical protein